MSRRFVSRPAARAAAAVALSLACLGPAQAAGLPAWLALDPGTTARVDIAPWLDADEPEAAITQSAASLLRDFSADASRPDDIVYEPVGIRVRVVKVTAAGKLAMVHGISSHFEGFAPLDRLIPEIPAGTLLIAAGGFGGFADFYPEIGTREKVADRVPTGSRLVAIGTGVAPYDPDSADLVRVHVRVLDGNLRGRTGWVAVAYTGLPTRTVPAGAEVAEKACGCRLIQFRS
jgi:hypothetical protein